MKTKLSEIEKLRLEKAELIEECHQYEERLLDRWIYTKENLGSLTVNSIFASAKMGLSDLFGGFFGSKETEEDSKASSGFIKTIMVISPIVWSIAQPLLFKFALRKIKSIFRH